jgi:hypothetical protein
MYSAQLRAEIDALESEKLAIEEQGATPFGDATFTLKSTLELQKLLEEIGAGTLPAWAAVARQLNNFGAQILEGISTILFLRRRGLKGEDLRLRLLALKPHLEKIYSECDKHVKALLSSTVS